MKLIKNLLLYISAFMPMYGLIFIKLVVEIINDNLTFNVLNSLNFTTLLLLMVMGILGLVWNIKFNNETPKEIIIVKKNNITDQHFLGYFSLFVFFAIPIDLSLVSGYCIYIVILILIGIVYLNNSLYYINPLLNILGYNFYNVTYKLKGDDSLKNMKMFYKGNLVIDDKTYWVKIKNDNFAFAAKKTHKKPNYK